MLGLGLDGQWSDRGIPPIAANVGGGHRVGRTEIGHWGGHTEKRRLTAKLAADPKFWRPLLASFDTIVIAAPSLQGSFDGVVLAAHADATILIVEAETTPRAVVINLRDTLASSGARLAGVIMNKRRYYIPRRVYRKL